MMMTTTTTVYLGWSGYCHPLIERDFNEKIVMKTNKVLKKIDINECSLDGGSELTIICDYDHSSTVKNIAASLRRAVANNESVRDVTTELVEEYYAAK